MPQPVEGFFLNLPDPFPGDVKPFTDLFQGVFGGLPDTKTQANYFFFPLGQSGQHLDHPAGKLTILHGIIGRFRLLVFQKITQGGIIIANRCLQ